jgi:hypothetical protein
LISTVTVGKRIVADYFSCRSRLEIGIRQGQEYADAQSVLPVETTVGSHNGETATRWIGQLAIGIRASTTVI